MQRFMDAAPVARTKRTENGYLIADANVVRTGIQLYKGWELDPDNEHGFRDRDMVKVYRPASSVFDKDSLQSFSHAPVTLGHPKDLVDSANWAKLSVGEVSTEALRDGESVRLPLILKDAAAITAVEGGVCELSAGYTSVLVFDAGITPDGEDYEVTQTNIRVNHVALVPNGRAGKDHRIMLDATSDGNGREWGLAPLQDADTKEVTMSLQKVLVDGLQVETTEAGVQAINKLTTALNDARAEAKTASDEADRKIAKLEADLEKANSARLDDAQIDARVKARADLISKATKVVKDGKFDGLSDLEIRKKVLTAKLGDSAVEGKSEAYIEARFDGLVEDAPKAKPDSVMANLSDAAPAADLGWGKVLKDQGYAQ